MEKSHKVELIGRPSIDRPWMKYYPESISRLQVPELSLNEYLKANCPGMDMVAMHYYGIYCVAFSSREDRCIFSLP